MTARGGCAGLPPAMGWPSPTFVRRRILGLYRELQGRASLAPGPRVNRLFNELVRLTLLTPERVVRAVLADPEIAAARAGIRSLCARGECALERHWSRRVCAAADPWRELERFPYYENYVQATRVEANCLFAVKRRFIRRVLFVGSGPLPLTSLCLAREHGIHVDNVDIDALACRQGERLARRLGLAGHMDFHPCDILDFADRRASTRRDYDAIFLASLVGMEAGLKARILRRLDGLLPAGSLLVIRSAHRLRTLVYPEVEEGSLEGFATVLEIHPHNEIMNSNLIVRKLPRGAEARGPARASPPLGDARVAAARSDLVEA